MRSKQDFDANATTWLRKWFSQYPNTPIRLIADSGYCTVLPPAMGNELRKTKEIDMYAFIKSVSLPLNCRPIFTLLSACVQYKAKLIDTPSHITYIFQALTVCEKSVLNHI
jgi:hypothetical protein